MMADYISREEYDKAMGEMSILMKMLTLSNEGLFKILIAKKHISREEADALTRDINRRIFDNE